MDQPTEFYTEENLQLKKIKLKIISLVLSGIMISALGGVHSALAADVKRIALLPFKINAEKDLSFLQDGIFDMLSTRLAKEGQVEVISRAQVDAAMQSAAASGTVNEAAARSIGSRLNADFVLFGSLTVLGENVSIDAKMVDISGGQPTLTFFDQSRDLGAVITKINLMAADINAKMFGRTQRTQTAAKTPAIAAQPPPAQKNRYSCPPGKRARGRRVHQPTKIRRRGFGFGDFHSRRSPRIPAKVLEKREFQASNQRGCRGGCGWRR